ncbi:inosine/xanthosine triphosphatase [Alteromonas oceanisediminis]|uniref:inosine/xanthosine triphosphatase n=1 Tax=Alteromonas oceanisediminis TaxID=2836180 RepID=UPI001BDB1A66|nr:inosine/xanthosine triphosphatase [Alteromonas oceanisediminis]MBT0587863.1 inosine/xanthosine triphosphatase [Alteromonas oceanisediminis]
MLSIQVGSTNPVKVSAAQRAISQWFADRHVVAQGVSVASGVADQPMSEAETRLGAVNRVKHCLDLQVESDKHYAWTLAYEGGVARFEDGPATFAYVAIHHNGQLAVGRSGNLAIPEPVFTALEAGEELGDVMDRVYRTHNIKQKGGAIGLLTRGLASRTSVYELATLMAMSRFEFIT